MSLLQRFMAHLAGLKLPTGPVLVAVSGGPDSVALLDLLVQSRDVHGLDLVVAHLDHGIHPASAGVAEDVRALAQSYGVPVEVGRLKLGSSAGETEARARRYAWLEATRDRLGAELILTAHHADDQVETVLMRFLAGSGPAGLAGMSPVTGCVVRPLLPFHRVELTAYLRQRGLSAWLDPANADARHLRSWIRTELLPMLRARLPEVGAHLHRVAGQAAGDRAAWEALLEVLPGLDLQVEPDAISVAASVLAGYDSALAEAVIRAAARRIGCRLGPSRMGRVFSLLESGGSGATVPLGDRWTAELTPYEVFERCQAQGVPAAPVLHELEALADPHLQARGLFAPNGSPETGEHLHPTHLWRWDGPPMRWDPLPVLGGDNQAVFQGVVGLTDSEYAALAADGHLSADYLGPDGTPL